MNPHIRLVVVNFNGGEMTLRCLRHLLSDPTPDVELDVVLVDNASTDGIADRVARELPAVRVIRHDRNLGFAGGANAGLRDLDGVDFVGLVNNDAFPEHGWLMPLVRRLETDDRIGAAAPKILLAPRFVEVRITTPTFRPGSHDPRELGVMVSGARFHESDRFGDAVFAHGFHGPEHGPAGPFQWTSGSASLWLPVRLGEDAPSSVQLRLASSRDVTVRVDGGTEPLELVVGAEPSWYEVPVDGAAFDVINNVGVRLVRGGWAGDRGFLEVDHGQFDTEEEIFGWCGAAVLMRTAYLADVGVFDDELFLYYEDTDLSWRGRLRGWRYVYEPASVVRHIHSATAGEGSRVFTHFVDRNRLLVYLRNAPSSDAAGAIAAYAKETWSIAWRDVVKPTIRRHARHPERTKQKLRSLGGFVRLTPHVLRDRARAGHELVVDRERVSHWAVPH